MSGMLVAARQGLSRYHSENAMNSGTLADANRAVALMPGDPEAHYARAVLLRSRGELAAAIEELDEAAQLRPNDYFLWQELASLRDYSGDSERAVADARVAVRLAPFYAFPRWQLGNLLLRAGQLEEAFVQLGRAAESDPELLNSTVDLAYSFYGEDVTAIENALQLQSPAFQQALVQSMIKWGHPRVAARVIDSLSTLSDQQRANLVGQFLTLKYFDEAFELWNKNGTRGAVGATTDSGFEGTIIHDEPGFGWQLDNRAETVIVSLDSGEAFDGQQSLMIRFAGDSEPSFSLIAQLVKVEPNARYLLSFAARTHDLITGGAPVLVVAAAEAGDSTIIGSSEPLPLGTSDWQKYTVEFRTSELNKAVRIIVRRQQCSEAPCPAFGRVWIDDVALRQLSD